MAVLGITMMGLVYNMINYFKHAFIRRLKHRPILSEEDEPVLGGDTKSRRYMLIYVSQCLTSNLLRYIVYLLYIVLHDS